MGAVGTLPSAANLNEIGDLVEHGDGKEVKDVECGARGGGKEAGGGGGGY